MFRMKYHLITAAILLVALTFYAFGYSALGGVAFVIGGVFELWFWVRLFRTAERPQMALTLNCRPEIRAQARTASG